MSERKERPRIPLEGNADERADMIEPIVEEPNVLPPPKKRRKKTVAEIREQLEPASRARQAIEAEAYGVEKEVEAQKEKIRKMRAVEEQLRRRAESVDRTFLGFGKLLKAKESRAAHHALEKVSEALLREEVALMKLQDELNRRAAPGYKILSAMQRDVRELQSAEAEASFQKSLEEFTRIAKNRPSERSRLMKSLLEHHGDREEEIKKAFSE